ncbi:MAG: hypothetical protein K6L73_14980 [Cellvibrionaceae bacterium]
MKVIALVFLIMFTFSVKANSVTCNNTDSLNALIAINPVVKVSPKYPNKGTQKPIDGCAVITFSLDRDQPTSVPKKMKVEYATEKRFGKASKKALSKWLYINKHLPDSKRYYMVFRFDV